MKYTTYIIIDPRDDMPIYVGQSNNFQLRKVAHVDSAKGKRPNIVGLNLQTYLSDLYAIGYLPKFEITEECSSEEESLKSELECIKNLVKKGIPVLNNWKEHKKNRSREIWEAIQTVFYKTPFSQKFRATTKSHFGNRKKLTMKIVFTESSLSSFEDFHDGDWLKQVAELVTGTEIEGLFEEFAAHWLGSARAFILPWLLVHGVYDGINSVVPLPSSPQDIWNGYLKITGFHAALWKLSEGMYCSIYYAYENLLVNLLRKIKGENIRVTDRNFSKQVIEVYGDKFANKIWNSNFLSLSREIRNCIVHNGGMASTRLLEMKPPAQIKKGNVIISASDTRKLYNELKPVVYELLDKSIKILQQKAANQ